MTSREELRDLLVARQNAFRVWLDEPSSAAKRRALDAALERVDEALRGLFEAARHNHAEPPTDFDAEPLGPGSELEAVDELFDAIEGEEADDWEGGLPWMLRLQATQERLRQEIESPAEEAMVGRSGDRDLRSADTTRGLEAGPEEIVPLQRTPHMDLGPGGPLAPGTAFRVTVWADTEGARDGEETEDVRILAAASITSFDIEVWLVTSEHFDVVRAPDEPLTIRRAEERSNTLTFELATKTEAALRALHDRGDLAALGRGFVRAVFRYRGQPSGKVTRRVTLSGLEGAAAGAPDAARLPPPALVADATAERPDLLIQIEADPEEPDRRFHCLLETPHLSLTAEERTGPWVLSEKVGTIVASYMALFTAKGKTDAQRLAALRGAGKRLFDAAPKNFHAVYWRLVDAGHHPAHLSIVTEDPYFPWELLMPHRTKPDGGKETREPLGVECAIGRWLGRNGVSARQTVSLSNSLVVAPAYEGRRKLEHAEEETNTVAGLFSPGTALKPVSFDTLDQELQKGPVSLIHFACHGKQTDEVSQAIFLDGDASLSSVEVAGMPGFEAALGSSHPLIFLNACEVGRLTPALAGVEGFAATFVDLGASAVVAPLWSVKDRVAHTVAMSFYDEIKNRPETPFAEILRRMRERAYQGDTAGEDSYGAYCFYGDPRARRATGAGG